MEINATGWKTPATMIADIVDTIDGFTKGTDLFVGYMPDKPANCVCVYDSGGGEQDPVNKNDFHNIQILGRNADYTTGYNLLNKIKVLLESKAATTVGGEVIIGIWVKSNIAFLERDKANNSLFSSNYRIVIDTSKNINRI